MTKLLSLSAVIAGALLLSGCTAGYRDACIAQGVQPGTSAFDDCVKAQEQATVQRIRARGYRPSGR